MFLVYPIKVDQLRIPLKFLRKINLYSLLFPLKFPSKRPSRLVISTRNSFVLVWLKDNKSDGFRVSLVETIL